MLLFLVLACPVHADEALVNVAGPQYGTRIEADTSYSSEYGGYHLGDGSLERGTGCWYSKDQTVLPCAVTFELANPEDIRRVVLHQAYWNGNMYHTKAFALETSADGTTWRRVGEGELPDESLARTELALPEGRVKWLRIVVLSSYNSFQTCGLAEVELLAADVPGIGQARLELNGAPAPIVVGYCGFTLACAAEGPQVVCVGEPVRVEASLREGERAALAFDLQNVTGSARVQGTVAMTGGRATFRLSAGDEAISWTRAGEGSRELAIDVPAGVGTSEARLECVSEAGEVTVRWSGLRVTMPGREMALRIPPQALSAALPPPVVPDLRPGVERALIEWDWMLQDGIGTQREPRTWQEALRVTLERGASLLRDLRGSGADLREEWAAWQALEAEAGGLEDGADAEALWRRAHWLKREIALKNPLAQVGPIAFARQVPGAFSHQLTQYYGRYARPGGDICVLEEPGRSMRVRSLTRGLLPEGSFQHPEVSFDGKRILFSYCEAPAPPQDTIQGHHGRYYHLYEIGADGAGLRRLTDGPFDDFSPRYLPDGRIVFISTRRGGWHRCGSPGCENYTLTVAEADGSRPVSISLHETQEWDPAVLHDGRIIYTRWDYVDRNAVFFEQLWTTAPDGSRPAIFYGNLTFNPVGVWEPRPVPGSPKVMATAAAHHAMTAGSIVLVNVAAGVDGKEPIERLTPDAPFPEGEFRVEPYWYSAKAEPNETPESRRWPGHCYRSPLPLSERYFLAAYSFEGLIGEPKGNAPNMFGLYLVDAFGNKELLFRDLGTASAWPMPVAPRPSLPAVPVVHESAEDAEATVVVQNTYEADPPLPAGSARRLRILQVLPKSTPGIDRPAVGVARGAPGKQVLGTVPIEADGSAHFRVPARTPIAFQVLDETGQAVQVMRSLTYLQPGEHLTCVGCHEPRTSAPPVVRRIAALGREASRIEPGPDGSLPLSYPLLVQPVLDRACVKCHSGETPAGKVRLTGEPDGHYTVSYNALAPRVPISDQGSLDALSVPGRYGAKGSGLMRMLLDGHHEVKLDAEEIERLVTWMDANALFYGTFRPEDQARQQRGERIAGADLF